MGCGCTHGSATMCKGPSCKGTDCAGGFGAGVSWAHDVPAHASTIARVVPAKNRKRVSVFTVEHEAYHCFLLLCFRLMPYANAHASLWREMAQLANERQNFRADFGQFFRGHRALPCGFSDAP